MDGHAKSYLNFGGHALGRTRRALAALSACWSCPRQATVRARHFLVVQSRRKAFPHPNVARRLVPSPSSPLFTARRGRHSLVTARRLDSTSPYVKGLPPSTPEAPAPPHFL